MRKLCILVVMVAFCMACAHQAHTWGQVVYTAKSQIQERMDKDMGAYSSWAKKETCDAPVALAEKGAAIGAGAEGAGIVLGTRIPVVLTSRADSLRTRLASAAVMARVAQARRSGRHEEG
jgi:hypothetical protein